MTPIRDRPLLARIDNSVWLFLALAFAISWVFYLLFKLSLFSTPVNDVLRLVVKFGPSLGGLIAAIYVARLRGALELLKRLIPSIRHWKWIVFALTLPFFMMGTATALRGSFDSGVWVMNPDVSGSAAPLFLGLLATRFFAGGGLGEELGWRGFMQPRLLETMTPLEASLLIGVFHGLWHLPAYGVAAILLVGFTIAMAVIATWMYQHTDGNLFSIALLHGCGNAVISSVDQLFPRLDNDVGLVLLNIVLWLALAGVLVATGRLDFDSTNDGRDRS